MARVCVSATAAVLTSFSACFGGFGRRRSVSPGARGDRIPPLTHNDNQCSRRTGAALHTHIHTHTKSNIKRTVDKASLSPSQSAFLFPPSVKERKLLAKLSFVRAFQRHSPNTGPSFRSSGIPFRMQFVYSVEKLWPLSRCCCDVFLPYDIEYCIRPIPHFTTGIVRVFFFFCHSGVSRIALALSSLGPHNLCESDYQSHSLEGMDSTAMVLAVAYGNVA